jgi:hypothetical protein
MQRLTGNIRAGGGRIKLARSLYTRARQETWSSFVCQLPIALCGAMIVGAAVLRVLMQVPYTGVPSICINSTDQVYIRSLGMRTFAYVPAHV